MKKKVVKKKQTKTKQTKNPKKPTTNKEKEKRKATHIMTSAIFNYI